MSKYGKNVGGVGGDWFICPWYDWNSRFQKFFTIDLWVHIRIILNRCIIMVFKITCNGVSRSDKVNMCIDLVFIGCSDMQL